MGINKILKQQLVAVWEMADRFVHVQNLWWRFIRGKSSNKKVDKFVIRLSVAYIPSTGMRYIAEVKIIRRMRNMFYK